MNAKRLMGALLAAGLGFCSIGVAGDALGQAKKPPAKNAAPAVAPDPPMTARRITLSFPGIGFGMPPEKVADAVDKILDEDYRPKYKAVQPGVEMRALDVQLSEEKATFRRSRIDFGRIPTGLDSSPLRGEYTYNNKETLMSLTRNGETVHFFFIQDRLWKMIGEHKLSDASSYGKDFQASVVKFSAIYGVAGRLLQPDGQNRFAVEVDWKDSNNHLRIIQRSDTAIGVALEDLATWQALPSLRVNKPSQDSGIDPSVAASLRHEEAPPGPPPKDAPKKK